LLVLSAATAVAPVTTRLSEVSEISPTSATVAVAVTGELPLRRSRETA
jgi:hypothetical protein